MVVMVRGVRWDMVGVWVGEWVGGNGGFECLW